MEDTPNVVREEKGKEAYKSADGKNKRILVLTLCGLVLLLLALKPGGEDVTISRSTTIFKGDIKSSTGIDLDVAEATIGNRIQGIDHLYSGVSSYSGDQACLVSNNPRTASVFLSGFLALRGKSRFQYVTRNCNKGSPVVRMVFQKDLPKVTQSISDKDTLIVQGDEYCRCRFKLCEDGDVVQARQYYNSQFDTTDATLPSIYLPLGPRLDFSRLPIQASELIRSSKRTYAFNLIASPTNPTRVKLQALAENSGDVFGPTSKSFIHITPAWSAKFNDTAAGFISTETYRRVVLNSAFTLCPAGHNPEAFRLFEAAEAGSIPVLALDSQYESHSCSNSFAPFVETNAPFIFLQRWSEFPDRLAQLLADPAQLERMQKDLIQWHSSYWQNVTARLECRILERHDPLSLPMNCKERSQQWKVDGQITGRTTPLRQVSLASSVPVKHPVVQNGVPLITGCGRSGTLSLAVYLKSIGIPAVHENVKQGAVSVSWLYAAVDKKYPFESLPSARLRTAKWNMLKPGLSTIFSPVVQLVRHPLKVISSTRKCFCGKGVSTTKLGAKSNFKSWIFVQKHVPQIPSSKVMPFDSIERSALYWYHWNALIEKTYPQLTRFRLEDLKPVELLSALGMSGKNKTILPESVPRASAHVSPEKSKDELVTWKDLYALDNALAKKVWDMAQRYGYEQGKTLEEAIAETYEEATKTSVED